MGRTIAPGWLMGIVALVGCNSWIDYPEDYRPSGATTLDDFVQVDKLGHFAFGSVLARFTDASAGAGQVLVDYEALDADPEAKYVLEQYSAMIAAVDPSALASTQERLAYWINGYNAAVIRAVLSRWNGDHRFSTIDDNGALFDDPLHGFGGQILTLNQVEHGAVRGDWQRREIGSASAEVRALLERWHRELWAGEPPDARLHAAFNCGALSCPSLPGAAPYVYLADALERQLADATRVWLDDPKKGAGAAGISALFDWYRDDFVKSAGSVGAFIAAHRTDGVDGVALDKLLEYDWTLNSTDNR